MCVSHRTFRTIIYKSKKQRHRNRGRYWDDRSLQETVITSHTRCSNSVKRCMSKVTPMERSVNAPHPHRSTSTHRTRSDCKARRNLASYSSKATKAVALTSRDQTVKVPYGCCCGSRKGRTMSLSSSRAKLLSRAASRSPARAIASGGEGRGARPRAADEQLVGGGQGVCALPESKGGRVIGGKVRAGRRERGYEAAASACARSGPDSRLGGQGHARSARRTWRTCP